MASRRCESVFELQSESWCVNCWSMEGAAAVSDCWLRTIDLALKLVSVKFAALAFVLPTLSLVFWKSCFFSLFFFALDPIVVCLLSFNLCRVDPCHQGEARPTTKKNSPVSTFVAAFCGVALSHLIHLINLIVDEDNQQEQA